MSSKCLQLLEKCKNLKQLKQAHASLISCGLGSNSFALSRVLAFCADPFHGSLSYGYKIFEHIDNPTICVCNTIIKSFLLKNNFFVPVEIYKLILMKGMYPDNYTLPYVLKACAKIKSLNLGGTVHGQALRLGFSCDNFVGNGLVAMYSSFSEMGSTKCAFNDIAFPCVVSWTLLISGYAKSGDVFSARLVFGEAPLRDMGIWGAMLSGYVQNNCLKEGLNFFRLMQLGGIKPDEGIFVSILGACAQMGSLESGIWIHRYVQMLKMPLSVKLATALIDMYAKCGKLDLAEILFDEIPRKDIICWNTMISGYAMIGNGKNAVKMFDEMRKTGTRPNDVTFISLFTACSYSDMAHEGLHLLNIMCSVYNIEPKSEHYGCIVDLLSRAKLIEDARSIVQRMPISGSTTEEAIALRALLGACCDHGRVEWAEVVAERLVKMESHSGAYVLLSNLYAGMGRHSEARNIRKMMRSRGVEKTPGCSSVEINGAVHEFVAGQKTHYKMDEIHELLDIMKKQMDHLHCVVQFEHDPGRT